MPKHAKDTTEFRVRIQKDTTIAGIRYKITLPKPLAGSKNKLRGSFEIYKGEVSFELEEIIPQD